MPLYLLAISICKCESKACSLLIEVTGTNSLSKSIRNLFAGSTLSTTTKLVKQVLSISSPIIDASRARVNQARSTHGQRQGRRGPAGQQHGRGRRGGRGRRRGGGRRAGRARRGVLQQRAHVVRARQLQRRLPLLVLEERVRAVRQLGTNSLRAV